MAGFTMLELTVAIALMALLASVMLSRFADLQRAARVGHLQALRGAVSAAATLTHVALMMRADQPDAVPCAGGGLADNRSRGAGTLCTDGGLVQTQHGYPASLALGGHGIVSAAGNAFNAVNTELIANGFSVSVHGDVTTFARSDARAPETCSFTYTQALVAEAAAAISVPVTAGC